MGDLAKDLVKKWKRLVMAYSPPRVEEDLSEVGLDPVVNHSQKSSDPDPDLFMATDGKPMAFLMSGKDKEAFKVRMDAENATKLFEIIQVKPMIEAGGGVLLLEKKDWSPEEQSLLPYAIRLLGPARAEELKARENYVLFLFSVKYIVDCVSENKILPNLLNYRLAQ